MVFAETFGGGAAASPRPWRQDIGVETPGRLLMVLRALVFDLAFVLAVWYGVTAICSLCFDGVVGVGFVPGGEDPAVILLSPQRSDAVRCLRRLEHRPHVVVV